MSTDDENDNYKSFSLFLYIFVEKQYAVVCTINKYVIVRDFYSNLQAECEAHAAYLVEADDLNENLWLSNNFFLATDAGT